MGTTDGSEFSLLHSLTGLQDPTSTASFLEVTFDAVISFDYHERITSWNPAAEKMFGWKAQESLGKTPAELFWPADMPLGNENRKQRQARLKRGETLQGELSPCRKDGSSFPAQFTARAIINSDGTINGYLAIYRDISDKVQAREKEEQLQQSNQWLNQILASIQDDFYVLNRDWVFVFASRTFTSRIGKEPEDFVGNNIWEMFPKHIGGLLYENFHAVMEKREIRRFEVPGRYTDAWYRMSVFPSEEGITVIGTDVTERRWTENVLRRQAQLLNLSSEAILVWELNGRIEYWNEGAEKLYGYSSDEAIGQVSHELLATLPPQGMTALLTALERDGEWRGELTHRTGDGRVVIAESNQQLIHQGQRRLVLETNRDVTERKQAENALRESEKQLQILNESLEQKVHEKTAEVRRLAAELVIAVQSERHRISHILHDDLQQRIYAIQMQLTFLRNELHKANQAAQNEALDIGKQLDEVLEITRNLSIDLSPPILQDEGLSQAINWLAGQMRKRYGLAIEIQADGPFIVPNEELQVLLFNCVRELLFNVVKHAEASRAVVTLQWLDDGLQIEVCDDGKGFPVKIEKEQPAEETNEEESLQLSFGLPTLRHQLILFGGRMEVRSEPGAGTRVTLIVPVVKTV
jgi:PAS domain S-box-containing protein